jgi:hypothetical protein
LRGAGSGFFLGVVEAKAGILAGARGAATAAIRESKLTQGHAVLCTERGHKSLLRIKFWDWLLKRAQAEACATNKKERRPFEAQGKQDALPGKPFQGKPAVQNRNAPTESGRNMEQRHCTTTVMRVKLKKYGQKRAG